MNQYTELLRYIKSIADSDVFINTVTQGKLDDKDKYKMDIYPLLHIQVNSGNLSNGKVINFDVILECAQVRDENKEIVNDKFFENDNEVDNHNETLAALNRLWNIMYKDFEKVNITSSEDPTLTKFSDAGTNILDGWGLEFTVEVPNTTLNLCQ